MNCTDRERFLEHRCCQDTALEPAARTVVAECSQSVADRFARQRLVAVILTGSLARGEGSLLAHGNGRISLLGDAEFLAVFPDRRHLASHRSALARLAQDIRRRLARRGIDCEFDITPVSRTYFQRVPPRIFSVELKDWGRVVWGDRQVLAPLERLAAKEIPLTDGFDLLSNRIIEQLILFTALREGSPVDDMTVAYQLNKLVLDMGGSLLVFLGSYRTSYAQRLSELNVLQSVDGLELDPVRRAVAEATAFKLRPREVLEETEEKTPEIWRRLWRKNVQLAYPLWYWEASRLASGSATTVEEQCRALLRLEPLRAKLRGWLKLLWLSKKSNYSIKLSRCIRRSAACSTR